MSRKKYTKYEINLFVKRAVTIFGLKTEKELSEFFGISQQSLSNKKTTQTIIDLIEKEVYKRNMNFDYILTGEGKPFSKIPYPQKETTRLNIASPEKEFKPHGGWTPQTDETDWGCIGKVARIIKSDTIYSKALLQNIDAFYEAVMAGEDRRKGERREQDIDYDGEDRRKGERRKKTASGE